MFPDHHILQIMGCTSDQYGSMERYLVAKARWCSNQGYRLFVVYENQPASSAFVDDLVSLGGVLLKMKCKSLVDLQFYRQLKTIARKEKIEIIHAYFTPTCHYVMFACLLLGIRKRFRMSANLPLTLYRSATQKGSNQELLYKAKQRLLSIFPRRIICRSEAIRQEFLEMGLPNKKLAVTSGGTDTNHYKRDMQVREHLRQVMEIKPETWIIGTACRLVPVKNLTTLLHSIPILLRVRSDFQVLITGDGPEFDTLKNLVHELSITDHVRFLGNRSDIVDLFSVFDLFVQASISEGMSNAILEAMACEVPIVVSDIPPNREIFKKAKELDCRIGELFEPRNSQMLAEKLSLMMQHNYLSDFGNNARYIVQSAFGIDARIEKEFAIYEGLA